MFCKHCGNPVKEGEKFCKKCGAEIEREPAIQKKDKHTQRKGKEKKKRKKGWIAGIAVMIIVFVMLAAGAGYYFTVGLNQKKEKLEDKITEAKIPKYKEDAKKLSAQWNSLGLTEIGEKRELIKEFQELDKSVREYQKCEEQVEIMVKKKESYRLDEESYKLYEEKLNQCTDAIEEKDPEKVISAYEEVQEALEELKNKNDSYVEEQMEMYQDLEMQDAEEQVLSDYEKNLKIIQKLAEKEEKDYGELRNAFAKMNETVYMYIEPETLLDIKVQQVDASGFPKIRLYMDMKNSATGEVPENLEDQFFYIKKKDANANYVKQTVTEVNQLNEKESLTIDMVADVSGSMQGSPIAEAKEIMCNFVNSVQFEAGDLVELTSFSTGVRIEQEFCGEESTLISKIQGLATGDQTSLYDALYTSVERVAAQNGARCVIAFTDGDDNYSNCTREDVVEVANRYHVPVFIIGIGSIDGDTVRYIAENTGGIYFGVDDVNSIEDIYDQIYRMEKEMYLVEFEDSTGSTVKDMSQIQAGYHSVQYGGECEYSYTPNILLNAKSLNIYQDGPEAVVEEYLKNFSKAVTNSDFSLISGCLKAGSSIYQEQEKYVLHDIEEKLDSYELTSVTYQDENHCVISTRETYYVQVAGQALQLMTQECTYAVEKSGDKWFMTALMDLKVVSRIKQ